MSDLIISLEIMKTESVCVPNGDYTKIAFSFLEIRFHPIASSYQLRHFNIDFFFSSAVKLRRRFTRRRSSYAMAWLGVELSKPLRNR